MSTIVRDLWPTDLVAEDVLGPQDILEYQANLLTRRMNSLIQGQVVRTDTGDRVILGFEVFAPKIDMTVRLFTVHHQSDAEYPALLVPPDDDVPGYLQEQTLIPGHPEQKIPSVMKTINSIWSKDYMGEDTIVPAREPRIQVNEWVAASPEQFTNKLERILNSSTVKAAIISLLAKSQRSQASTNPPESPT